MAVLFAASAKTPRPRIWQPGRTYDSWPDHLTLRLASVKMQGGLTSGNGNGKNSLIQDGTQIPQSHFENIKDGRHSPDMVPGLSYVNRNQNGSEKTQRHWLTNRYPPHPRRLRFRVLFDIVRWCACASIPSYSTFDTVRPPPMAMRSGHSNVENINKRAVQLEVDKNNPDQSTATRTARSCARVNAHALTVTAAYYSSALRLMGAFRRPMSYYVTSHMSQHSEGIKVKRL
ncbi:hypothetical protein EDB89DRAFT_1540768 [Lactarius sanguifluus]|nr:hypothetical protein EDB89DRAFT_1540768 [Lactarius sanguifluus]